MRRHSMIAVRRIRQRTARRHAVVLCGIAALFALGACSSDEAAAPASTTASSESVGDAPVPSSAPVTEPVAPTDASIDASDLDRALLAPGTFTCTAVGRWQPFAERPLIVSVGESTDGQDCPPEIVQLPSGSCSTTPCSTVPDDWEIRFQSGVSPDKLLVVVTPTANGDARFYCYFELMPAGVSTLPVSTSIERACIGATSTTSDIPYVPPATSDIPYVPPATSDIPFVPPPPSADIPAP